ncbi:MMPL family transporter [Mycobacterium simiae]|uniref:MMPL family transporter n=1 Tax=Mycobacterium simiae TaxID=1784 RepID=A0A5B1BQX2_MYCSI|nr:MMPL family transporter [Mycobacterium simiae]
MENSGVVLTTVRNALPSLTAVAAEGCRANEPPTKVPSGEDTDARFRDEVADGVDRAEALIRTMATAGRTVLFSAVPVGLSMVSMVLFLLYFLKSVQQPRATSPRRRVQRHQSHRRRILHPHSHRRRHGRLNTTATP